MMSDEKSGQATGTQTSKVKAMAAQEDAQEIQAQASEETSYDSGRDSPLTSYPAVLTLAEVEDLAGEPFSLYMLFLKHGYSTNISIHLKDFKI